MNVVVINSVSGGKSSGLMYDRYPADFNVFALVLSGHPTNRFQDRGIYREVQNRIPWAEGSMELEVTVRAMLDLEQKVGREIAWVASHYTYEQLIGGATLIPGYRSGSMALPNSRQRFCTEHLKVSPIHEWVYLQGFENPPLMNIGLRADEGSRVKRQDKGCKLNRSEIALSCEVDSRKHRWTEQYWREVQYPLYRDGICQRHAWEWMKDIGIEFPDVSNCAYCMFHSVEEHRRQYEKHPGQASTWIEMEERATKQRGKKTTFHSRHYLKDVLSGEADLDDLPLFACQCTD